MDTVAQLAATVKATASALVQLGGPETRAPVPSRNVTEIGVERFQDALPVDGARSVTVAVPRGGAGVESELLPPPHAARIESTSVEVDERRPNR